MNTDKRYSMLPRESFRKVTSAIASLLAVAVTTHAQITVEGVTNQTVTSSSVTFRVLSESGYTYDSRLDDQKITEDAWITVSRPMYHRIDVSRTNNSTGSNETREVQFVILDPSRGVGERGLYPWTPYRLIDSSSNECSSANLLIVTPSNYPANLSIPVIAIAEDSTGLWKRINGKVSLSGFTNAVTIKRGVGHTFLPSQSTGTVISCTATLKSISTNKTVVIDDVTTWTDVAADITNDTAWSQNSRMHVVTSVTVTAGATLTVNAGAVVLLDPGVNVTIMGTFRVNGTLSEPAVFTPANSSQPWGGFMIWQPSGSAVINGAIFTGSGADSNWTNSYRFAAHRGEQPLFYFGQGTATAMTNVFAVDLAGQGFHGETGTLRMASCLIQKCASTIGQFNSCTNDIFNCAFLDVPDDNYILGDADRDGPYCDSGKFVFNNTLVGWCQDDGIDGGNNGAEITISNCWFDSAFHEGMAWSSTGQKGLVQDTVFINNGQGCEAGNHSPIINVDHCLLVGNEIGIRFGDSYLYNLWGHMYVSNSISLYNYKDVWNMCLDTTWGPKINNLGLTNNYFTTWYPEYPSNTLWNGETDGVLLLPFIQRASAPGPVGVGFPTFSVTNDESVTSACVDVCLSMFSTGTVTVAYGVTSGTASPGSDYVVETNMLTFSPGEIRKQICLNIVQDQLKEPDETIIITLTNAVNAEISGWQSSFTYTIGSPYFRISEWYADPTSQLFTYLQWDSVTGRIYSVETSTNLLAAWANVSDPAYTNFVATGTPIVYTNAMQGDTNRFFRVRVRHP